MTKLIVFLFIVGCLLLGWNKSFAKPWIPQTSYAVCFTPQMDCTAQVVSAIDNAVATIFVQAYSFTSRPIGRALVTAKERGVKVAVILDKSNLQGNQGTARYFAHHGIPVWIDSPQGIAHNKIMIIDKTKIITGSFNFTRAAQIKNVENVLFIEDTPLANKYLSNWQSRVKVSHRYLNTKNQWEYHAESNENNILEALWNWLLALLRAIFSIRIPQH